MGWREKVVRAVVVVELGGLLRKTTGQDDRTLLSCGRPHSRFILTIRLDSFKRVYAFRGLSDGCSLIECLRATDAH